MGSTVAVVGSVNIDHVVVSERFPRPGETLTGDSSFTGLGGKGANQAVAAAGAGGEVALVGHVGDDEDGARALVELRRRGVGTTWVERVAAQTGTAWITLAGGENTIVVIPGANHAWDLDGTAPPMPRVVHEADVVLAQQETPLAVVVAAAAATRGLFVLNAAPSRDVPDSLLARCDVVVVNEHELADLTGSSAVDGSLDAALALLLRRGARAVVATLGAAGAAVASRSGVVRVSAPHVDVLDTTGAGDAFCGALATRLAAGDDLVATTRWGVAAGSLATQSLSAQGSTATPAEVAAVAADLVVSGS